MQPATRAAGSGREQRPQDAARSDQRAGTAPYPTARELELYLHTAIPLSLAMQVSVLAADAMQVALQAPLAPNVNHRGTVFGGSAYTLATLAAWSLLHCRLKACGAPASVVLQSASMRYQRPIAGAFAARAELASTAQWPLFLRTLARRGRARITLCAQVSSDEGHAARFEGEFVALADGAAGTDAGGDAGGDPGPMG